MDLLQGVIHSKREAKSNKVGEVLKEGAKGVGEALLSSDVKIPEGVSFKKERTDVEQAVKEACGNPLIKGKPYKKCRERVATEYQKSQIQASQPIIPIPEKKGIPTWAWIVIGVFGAGAIGTGIYFMIKK